MSFDPRAYEREQRLNLRSTVETMRTAPFVTAALDEFGRGPAIMTQCGRQHALVRVALTMHPDADFDQVCIEPIADHRARKGQATVTSPGEPWRFAKGVCYQPGCPTLVPWHGACELHGGPHEHIGAIRTIFSCRLQTCSWKQQPVTTVRLLQRYAMALHVGSSVMPLSDTR